MELGFHAVCVKVNVRIHGLNVHLIGVATQTIILGIVATGIFNQGLLQKFQNALVVLCIDFNLKGFNPAILTNLHGSIGGKVVAELTKVFTVIVLQNQNGVPCVLLHIVFKVGNHGVDSVLKGFHTADQGDFLFVILEGNQRNPCPVEPLGFLAFFLNHEIVFVFTGFHIGNQHIILIDIPVNAIGFEDFHLLHLFLLVAVPHFLGVVTNRTIKDGVIIVSPKRKNVIGREMLEGQFTSFIVVRIKPANATVQGIFTNIFQKPVKPFVENLAQSIRVTLILTVQGEGLAHKVVGFLIHHQGILVINQAVVRKVRHHLKLTVFTNDCALTLKNVMLSFIVQITYNLILAALTILPFLDFSGEELIFSHAGSPTLKDQAVDTLHSVIQKHIHLPPFFIA